jgi:pyridoxamine 5'-phosphate oxidase
MNKIDDLGLDKWNLRREYLNASLNEKDILSNPFEQFNQWYQDALKTSILEPNAMALATVGKDNKPSVRFVLCKGFDNEGLYFYTNYNSSKGKQILENSNVATTFFWDQLERQIRIEGIVKKAPIEVSDNYFNTRPRDAQINAAASFQSKPAESREEIEKTINEFEISSKDSEIKRPLHWGGYIIEPNSFEFWQGRQSRLHDRITYNKSSDHKWATTRLYP